MNDNLTDEQLQLADVEGDNRIDFFTDFVDEIEDDNFDNFLSRKNRQKRLEERKARQEGRLTKRGERKDARSEAKDLRRATRQGMTLEEYRASMIDADTDENTQLEDQRDSLDVRGARSLMKYDNLKMKKRPAKAVLKEQVNKQNDAIINGETPIDVPSNDSSVGGSFFEENKQMIMIGGGILLAGIVYFKFIKK
tara:strand:- start:1664 stop:2248 length:585 start_codon:yes stop_codon:yes gene_type:complete